MNRASEFVGAVGNIEDVMGYVGGSDLGSMAFFQSFVLLKYCCDTQHELLSINMGHVGLLRALPWRKMWLAWLVSCLVMISEVSRIRESLRRSE